MLQAKRSTTGIISRECNYKAYDKIHIKTFEDSWHGTVKFICQPGEMKRTTKKCFHIMRRTLT